MCIRDRLTVVQKGEEKKEGTLENALWSCDLSACTCNSPRACTWRRQRKQLQRLTVNAVSSVSLLTDTENNLDNDASQLHSENAQSNQIVSFTSVARSWSEYARLSCKVLRRRGERVFEWGRPTAVLRCLQTAVICPEVSLIFSISYVRRLPSKDFRCNSFDV